MRGRHDLQGRCTLARTLLLEASECLAHLVLSPRQCISGLLQFQEAFWRLLEIYQVPAVLCDTESD